MISDFVALLRVSETGITGWSSLHSSCLNVYITVACNVELGVVRLATLGLPVDRLVRPKSFNSKHVGGKGQLGADDSPGSRLL